MFDKKQDNLVKKLVIIGGSVVLASSNAFALTASDFDTASALADIGLAAIAVIGIAVLILGFNGVKKMLGFG